MGEKRHKCGLDDRIRIFGIGICVIYWSINIFSIREHESHRRGQVTLRPCWELEHGYSTENVMSTAPNSFPPSPQAPAWLTELIEHSTWRSVVYQLAEEFPECLMLNFTIKVLCCGVCNYPCLLLNHVILLIHLFFVSFIHCAFNFFLFSIHSVLSFPSTNALVLSYS